MSIVGIVKLAGGTHSLDRNDSGLVEMADDFQQARKQIFFGGCGQFINRDLYLIGEKRGLFGDARAGFG